MFFTGSLDKIRILYELDFDEALEYFYLSIVLIHNCEFIWVALLCDLHLSIEVFVNECEIVGPGHDC